MNSDTPAIDYAVVLADLEARRAQLDAAIAGIRLVLGMPGGVTATVAGTSAPAAVSTEIESDTFFGLSIPEAAKKYLGMRKKPATTPEIGEALKRGGHPNAGSDNFGNTLGSVLARAYAQGAGIVKVSRGTWGLAEWYPNKPRKAPRSAKGEAAGNGSTEGEDSSQADGDSE